MSSLVSWFWWRHMFRINTSVGDTLTRLISDLPSSVSLSSRQRRHPALGTPGRFSLQPGHSLPSPSQSLGIPITFKGHKLSAPLELLFRAPLGLLAVSSDRLCMTLYNTIDEGMYQVTLPDITRVML